MRKDITKQGARVFVPSDDTGTLWYAVGIQPDRFHTIIKPTVDRVFAAGGKIADAFSMISAAQSLSEIEKMYCIFEVSKVCAYRDVKFKIKQQTAGRIPDHMVDQMFGGFENLG